MGKELDCGHCQKFEKHGNSRHRDNPYNWSYPQPINFFSLVLRGLRSIDNKNKNIVKRISVQKIKQFRISFFGSTILQKKLKVEVKSPGWIKQDADWCWPTLHEEILLLYEPL